MLGVETNSNGIVIKRFLLHHHLILLVLNAMGTFNCVPPLDDKTAKQTNVGDDEKQTKKFQPFLNKERRNEPSCSFALHHSKIKQQQKEPLRFPAVMYLTCTVSYLDGSGGSSRSWSVCDRRVNRSKYE